MPVTALLGLGTADVVMVRKLRRPRTGLCAAIPVFIVLVIVTVPTTSPTLQLHEDKHQFGSLSLLLLNGYTGRQGASATPGFQQLQLRLDRTRRRVYSFTILDYWHSTPDD